MGTVKRDEMREQWEQMVDSIIGKPQFEEAFRVVTHCGIGSVEAVERVMNLMAASEFFKDRVEDEVQVLVSAFIRAFESKRESAERMADLYYDLARILLRMMGAAFVLGACAGTAAVGITVLKESLEGRAAANGPVQ